MLVCKCKFKTVICKRDDGILRVCTGEHLATSDMSDDDWDYAKAGPDDSVLIRDRHDVYKAIRKQLTASWLLALFGFAAFIASTIIYMRQLAIAGHFIFNWNTAAVGLTALVFVVFLHQSLTPIVHDVAGHWVNLKNGSSNLCGGICISRRSTWQ